MTDFETEYVFCKDNSLLLIEEYLFAKASTANVELELLKPFPLPQEHQVICIKVTEIQSVLALTLKVAILTSYKKFSVRYFELKLYVHTLGTSETCFTSCKKEHNRSPLTSWKPWLYVGTDRWFPQSPPCPHCDDICFTCWLLLLILYFSARQPGSAMHLPSSIP